MTLNKHVTHHNRSGPVATPVGHTGVKHVAPQYGNLKVIDVGTRHLSMNRLSADFNQLSVDPYVKEGFRRKHIGWFLHRGDLAHSDGASKRFERLPNMPLFQSAAFNPTHGDLARTYPELLPTDPAAMTRLLSLFAEYSEMPIGESVLLQYQRITCRPDQDGEPSVEGWHRDGVTRIGILCVARDGIEGGVNEFKVHRGESNGGGNSPILGIDLKPGQMAVFEDEPVRHRVTPIHVVPGHSSGHRDVVLFSFGGQLTA